MRNTIRPAEGFLLALLYALVLWAILHIPA